MVQFPFALILFPYGLVVLFVLIFALANIFHLIHYGATTAISFVVTFAYLAGMVFLFYFTWTALTGTDWQMPIVFDAPSFNKPPEF